MNLGYRRAVRSGRQDLPSPGLYGYNRTTGAGQSRVHLRLDGDGHGLLLINANRALHLNPTAALMAWLLLEQKDSRQSIRLLRRRYRVDPGTAQKDMEQLRGQLDALMEPNGACPIHDLELEIIPPFSRMPDAPYRMDLALSYRCNCDCDHCYNARPRSYPEISTEAWIQILDRLWDIGVPHICFTGGEATLRDDLPELIAYAEGLGQITGLLTNGRRISDRTYLDELLHAGLDHVQITIESHDPRIHDGMVNAPGAWKQTVRGIQNALDSRLYVMTNTTLLRHNASSIAETIDFLAQLGVPTIGCNALIYSGSGQVVGTGLPEGDLGDLLEKVRDRTQQHGQRLIWYTPTQYCHFDPVQMELGVKGCTAAMYNMCIEPDGGVIPCQSYYQPVGNILEDAWDTIWHHNLSVSLRERKDLPENCGQCPVLQECGGGCPLSLSHQQPRRYLARG